MSGTQNARTSRGRIASSAIWLTCPDCGMTSRVLAVMAGRVLKERPVCPDCLSTRLPHLRQSAPGAHIPASEAEQAAGSDEEQAYLRAWIEANDTRARLHPRLRMLLGRLAARFSRTKPVTVHTPVKDRADEHGLDLSHL